MNKKYLFIDIESTGLSSLDDKLHGIAVMKEEDQAQYFPVWDLPEWLLNDLKDPTVIKVFHSGSRFDPVFIHRSGIEIVGPFHDTLFIYKALDENGPLGLKPLTERYRGKEFLKNKRELDKACNRAGVKSVAGLCKMDLKDPEHEHFPIISKYALEDIENTYWLYFHGKKLLKERGETIQRVFGKEGKTPAQHLGEVVFPLDSVLFEIDKRGVKANMELLDQIRKEKATIRDNLKVQMYGMFKDYVDGWEEEAYKKAVAQRIQVKGKAAVKRKSLKYKTLFNWDSQEHVAPMIYGRCKVPQYLIARSTKTNKYSLDKNAVMAMLATLKPEHPAVKFLRVYQEYKKVHKIANTYTGNAKTGIFSKIRDGRLWTKYYQTPVTWRLASSGPNLQNLPKKSIVHKFFIPDAPESGFFAGDYSQIELMCAAHLSQEPKMLEAFASGEDLHRKTASIFFDKDPKDITDEERACGKTANFLLIYLGNWKKLQFMLKQNAGLDFTEDECRNFVDRFFEEYDVLDVHLTRLVQQIRKYRCVYLAETGAIRRVPDIKYMDYLDWNNYTFTGPAEMAARAIAEIREDYKKRNKGQEGPPPTPEQIFWQCYRYGRSARNQAINFPCQSLAAYINGKALIALSQKGYDIVNSVHDENKIQLRLDDISKAAEIVDIMENTYKLSCKLKVDWDIRTSFSKEDKIDIS